MMNGILTTLYDSLCPALLILDHFITHIAASLVPPPPPPSPTRLQPRRRHRQREERGTGHRHVCLLPCCHFRCLFDLPSHVEAVPPCTCMPGLGGQALGKRLRMGVPHNLSFAVPFHAQVGSSQSSMDSYA